MKMIDRFEIREIAGEYFAVPCEKAAAIVPGLISLNEVGVDIFRCFSEGKDLQETAAYLCAAYDVSSEKAEKDVSAFYSRLSDLNIFE